MKVFPVDLNATPRPYYAQAFNDKHKGTDIFAPKDTNVFAVDDGQVRKDDDPKGGTVAYLTAADGTRYYYAHLTEFIGASPRAVKAGEVIGTVGNTGNAQGKAPHVHFQIALPEVGTVDPYQFLLDVDPKGREKKPPVATTDNNTAKAPKGRAFFVVVMAALVIGGAAYALLRTKREVPAQ